MSVQSQRLSKIDVVGTKNTRQYFVSYNNNDRSWASWIAWEIEETGFRVVVQDWDFVAGTSWPKEMQKAVDSSHVTVCILSTDFVSSEFTAAEWFEAFSKDPVGKNKALLPVRVKECHLPGFLRTRVYVDLVGKEEEEARNLLRAALLETRNKPSSKPDYPGNLENSGPSFPGAKTTFVLVLDGTFSEYDRSRVESITEHLRKLLGDANITITEIEAGSVVLTLSCTKEAYDKFEALFGSAQLQELGCDRIIGFWKVKAESKSNIEAELRSKAYTDWLEKTLLKSIEEEAQDGFALNDILVAAEVEKQKKITNGRMTVIGRMVFDKASLTISDISDEETDNRAIAATYVDVLSSATSDEGYLTQLVEMFSAVVYYKRVSELAMTMARAKAKAETEANYGTNYDVWLSAERHFRDLVYGVVDVFTGYTPEQHLERIRQRARDIYNHSGRSRSALDNWLEAEEEMRSRVRREGRFQNEG